MDDHRNATAPRLSDASGRIVADPTALLTPHIPEGIGGATARFELHSTGPKVAIFDIWVIANVHTYPFRILGGSIGGDICTVPTYQWVVTRGSFGPHFTIDAVQARPPNAPQAALVGEPDCYGMTMSVLSSFQPPDSYSGTYGFSGVSDDFEHTTLFKGWLERS
jgi:hypothetical protein